MWLTLTQDFDEAEVVVRASAVDALRDVNPLVGPNVVELTLSSGAKLRVLGTVPEIWERVKRAEGASTR